MRNHLPNTKRISLIITFLFFIAFSGWTQVFQNGIRKGVIKVKFAPTVSKTLSKVQTASTGKTLKIGITSFDAVAKSTSATNMYRLFTYDARNESKLQKHGLDLWYVIEINENIDPIAAVAQFKQLNEITIAEVEHEKVLAPYIVKDYVPGTAVSTTLPFNDPMLKDQWHYNNVKQSGYGDADINLFEAWKKTSGSSNIIVSVHDEGVDVNHIDLRKNIWINEAELNGITGVDDDLNGYVDDINGYNFQKNIGAPDAQFHGTHVAGTIAAVNNNGIGVSGIAGGTGNGDGVKIMSLQIFGGLFENSYIYAANNGAVISQNSWGYLQPFYFDQSIKEAIDYFVAEAGNYPGSPMKGGIVIFAAGNSNYDSEWYPGYFSNVLSVSAIGPEWKKTSYSNYGDWVEIAAPGGDLEYGAKSGVLSTTPKDSYSYLQGTSMACPHVTGIAALALANRNKQLTNTELWNKLITGVVSIDEYNSDFLGKLGSGAIDAALAIQNDLSLAPATISDLKVTGIAQEFATLEWTVPADNDDSRPTSFQLYINTQPITAGNLSSASKTILKNTKAAGEVFSYEATGLFGITSYYFALTSTDRWGNISLLSNIVNETTNEGPSIAIDENSLNINLEIDIANSTTANHNIVISNNATGVLRWNHLMRHRNATMAFNASNIHYPVVKKVKSDNTLNVALREVSTNKNVQRSNVSVESAFTPIEKSYATYPTDVIGETDLSLTNSSAAKFFVTEEKGFNLTQVRMYLKHDPEKGPVIMEIYKDEIKKSNLLLAQEHNNYGTSDMWAYITLDEQIFFEPGETFWVVFHVPSGNLYPLGLGPESEPENSNYCFMSLNLGSTWIPLEEAINDKKFAWAIVAASETETLGNYLSLNPGSGDIAGNSDTSTMLTADGAALVNGSYSANLIIRSNDANKTELRVPVNVNITGHLPNIKHIDIANFGAVFVGNSKTLELVLENDGYGNFNNPEFTVNNDQFTIEGSAPWQIEARSEAVLKINFKPSTIGNINDLLTISNGAQIYEIPLFGVGTETSKIVLSPETQLIDNLSIGDEVNAQITVNNTGAFPLKYFIPGFDSKGISNNWPTDYHKYGYTQRSNQINAANPLPYEFQDIKSTGIDITSILNTDYEYFTVEMGFDFPYYGQNMQTLYIARKGFTTFDNTVNPINTPRLGGYYEPRGYISPLGGYFSYLSQGQILYQVEADRVIVQFDNVWDGYNAGESITAQMVLFSNGNIRFYYQTMGYSESNQNSLSILIEDLDKQDGILLHNWETPIKMFNELALGFDYPGPNIISKIENGSGIIAPGNSAIVNATLSTSSLTEGLINRYVNFISNDPSKVQNNALIQLNINSGGVAQSSISADTLDFGNVFQGAAKSKLFTIKNNGTADVEITGIAQVNNGFILIGEQPTSIPSGLYKKYEVQVPTSSLTTIEDWLLINYADGSNDTIYLHANIVEAPGININLDLLQQTLNFGDTISLPYTIENTGLGILEVTTNGKEWLSFDAPATTANDVSYIYEKHNTGAVYQWFDIRKTGTQLPFMDFDNFEETFWRELTLPFPIEFYGEKYSSFKIGDNGIISFEEDPEASLFTEKIPAKNHPGPCLMPYWTFSGFSDYLFPIEDIGIFYQFFDDKIIVTWSYFTNNFGGMGDPVSSQVIFYKNGTMKFQYKVEEGGADITSKFSGIGMQKDSTNGFMISEYQDIDHGQGLAYFLIPAKKLTIEPNSTLTGQINLDARNVYGGVYNESLKIQTNVPGNEILEKPIELTVTGDAIFVASDTIDFGTRIITFEYGSPVVNSVDLNFTNEGAAPYQITWAQMSDGSQGLSMQLLVKGFFGSEWSDIGNVYSPWAWETPTYTIMPGDVLSTRAVFSPSMAGDFNDEIVITTSIGEQRIVLKGTAVDPPVITVDQTPINVLMNHANETVNKTIDFSNLGGKSDLEYSLSVEFSRTIAAPLSAQTFANSRSNMKISSVNAAKLSSAGNIRTTELYNRVISHTEKKIPDTFIGNEGTSEFTLATKFNAGPDGFNLSHVETFFRTESFTTGEIKIEIRAGGTSITNAKLVAKGKLEITGSGSDDVGNWYQVKMEKPAGIYPNEDFYVVVTYPFGISYPQGSITDSEKIEGRYFYLDLGLWYDIQNEPDFGTAGWLMFAAEETPASSSWVTITSALQGNLAADESGTVNLHIDGSIANPGEQIAKIVFTSSDPVNPVIKVPVSLHLNDAPHFLNVPVNVTIEEGGNQTIEIPVIDFEGNSFSLNPAKTYTGISHTFEDGKLSIVLNPDYGDEGDYSYAFTAIDEYNASRDMTLYVKVIHSNQAPKYTASTKTLVYYSYGEIFEYDLNAFFIDPDEDPLTFQVVNGNGNVANLFVSANQFLIKPLTKGETALSFTVMDSYGAVLKDTISVIVNEPNSVSELSNDGYRVYPNPSKGKFNVFFPNNVQKDAIIKITNAIGSTIYTGKVNTSVNQVKLDISAYPNGIYFVTITGNTIEKTIMVVKN